MLRVAYCSFNELKLKYKVIISFFFLFVGKKLFFTSQIMIISIAATSANPNEEESEYCIWMQTLKLFYLFIFSPSPIYSPSSFSLSPYMLSGVVVLTTLPIFLQYTHISHPLINPYSLPTGTCNPYITSHS